MTWTEMALKIARMSPEQQEQQVLHVVQPRFSNSTAFGTKDLGIFPVGIYEAPGNIKTTTKDCWGNLNSVVKGDFCLVLVW